MRIAVAKHQEKIKAAPIDIPMQLNGSRGIQSGSNQSPHRNSAKREFFNNYVETLGASWELGFDSGTSGDSVPRKNPLTAG